MALALLSPNADKPLAAGAREYPTFSGGATDQSFGFYWIGEQMVWRERAGADDGVTLWYAMVMTPSTGQALFPFFAGSGAGWEGAISGRDDDWILFGSYYGLVSRDFAAAQQNAGQGNPLSNGCWGGIIARNSPRGFI